MGFRLNVHVRVSYSPNTSSWGSSSAIKVSPCRSYYPNIDLKIHQAHRPPAVQTKDQSSSSCTASPSIADRLIVKRGESLWEIRGVRIEVSEIQIGSWCLKNLECWIEKQWVRKSNENWVKMELTESEIKKPSYSNTLVPMASLIENEFK